MRLRKQQQDSNPRKPKSNLLRHRRGHRLPPATAELLRGPKLHTARAKRAARPRIVAQGAVGPALVVLAPLLGEEALVLAAVAVKELIRIAGHKRLRRQIGLHVLTVILLHPVVSLRQEGLFPGMCQKQEAFVFRHIGI